MDFPLLLDGQRFTDAGILTAATNGTILSHSGTAHVKGPYTQLVASTAFDAAGFVVAVVNDVSAAAISYLVDIAVGAAGAEQVLVPNLLMDTASIASRLFGSCWVPLPIAAGSRISARLQNSTTTGTLAVGLTLMGGGLSGLPSGGQMTALGADPATSNGTIIDAAATAHTKGAYSQLTASTPHAIRAVLLSIGSNKNSVPATNKWLVDIAVGAAGAEQVLVGNLLFTCGQERPVPSLVGPLPCSIPAGVRVAARSQCSVTDTTDRKIALVLYGIG
jgi:hypothetical protein